MLKHNFDLEPLLNPPGINCVTSFGSEFKSINHLEKLLHRHPRWNILREKLTKGVHFPLNHLSEDLRIQDLEEAYSRGNHKSAERNEAHLASSLEKEVKKGWTFVIPEDKYKLLPNLVLSPMGVAEQAGISALGEFIPNPFQEQFQTSL